MQRQIFKTNQNILCWLLLSFASSRLFLAESIETSTRFILNSTIEMTKTSPTNTSSMLNTTILATSTTTTTSRTVQKNETTHFESLYLKSNSNKTQDSLTKSKRQRQICNFNDLISNYLIFFLKFYYCTVKLHATRVLAIQEFATIFNYKS
jgi:hypothetical protein